ncbi:hypothetical protein A2837_00530 [Candidatus Kaiserbacteria bacterium RIFCSPHIGHO2_01_FULL_46_22]|uniref:GMP synthase n=1 Tax=Candidatus Kaiserbacteria bacterium RIFCSPHIGHO2_01_FULL_46_22 TaxID=1798475 RepID=A0A1F6BXI6_9BACT|nr:MAG: hypothetical protein A2837_00530 [Candidatus Kaiserbacteria bacterium RIFCSPHIGHO2_01_FULL_46_22]
MSETNTKSTVAAYFKEVIYGGIDGIITTFAVVSGFSGAALSNDATVQASFVIVLLFGLANLFADAVSMGLGNFLSVRAEKDLYNVQRIKERELIRRDPELEVDETVEIMIGKGFSENDARTLAAIYRHNEEYWLDFMMNNEYEMSDPRGDNPALTGFSTFAAFLVFGSIPLLPFFFLSDASSSALFQVSAVGTMIALILLGLLKWRVVGTSLWRSVLEVVLVGSVAAVIAFMVGTFFSI